MPIAPEEMIGERVGGRFVIERIIGDGPVSSAYRAQDTLLSRRVTVKLFHPAHPDDGRVVSSQLALAQAVARLSHPNIVTVIDRGEHEGMPFVVLEYVRGESLEERIERFAPLDVAEVIHVGEAIARALAYAHGQGVIHGNLRPQNVLISLDREVKLVDFGGGSYLQSLSGRDPYRLPEPVRIDEHADEVDERHDLYALGVLLFAALTEQDAEPGVEAGYIQVLRPDAPVALARIVARMLSERGNPYTSMHEVASDLAAARPRDSRAVHDRGGMRGLGAAAGPAAAAAPPEQATQVHQLPPDASEVTGSGLATGPLDLTGPTIEQRRAEQRRARAERRGRMLVWAAIGLPVLGLMVLIAMLSGEGGSSQKQAGSSPDRGSTDKVALSQALAFDPLGDGTENDGQVGNLIDGDTTTAWESEGYETELDQQKEGVGFLVMAEAPAEAVELRLLTDLVGWRAQVFAADEPGKSLARYTPVSSSVEIEKNSRIPLDTDGQEYGVYLVWITSLVPDVDGKYRARALEIELRD